MKILIVSPFFPPRNVVASWRAFSWAKAWREAGHEVTVLTAESIDETNGKRPESELAGVEVIRAGQGTFFKFARIKLKKPVDGAHRPGSESIENSFSSRLISTVKSYLHSTGILASVRWPDPWFFWKRNALKLVNGRRFDVAVCTFGPVSSLGVGKSLKQNGQLSFLVADFRDLWTGNSSFPGVWFLRPIERILETSVLRKSDLISTVSDPLKEKLKSIAPEKTVTLVSNGYEKVSNDDSNFMGGNAEKVVVAYTGTVYLPYQSPRALFSVLRKLKSKLANRLQVEFYGANSAVLLPLVREFELDEIVKLNGIVPRDQSIKIQRSASALLFLESTETPGREGIVTGKIFEYFAAKRPVLAIGVSKSSVVGKLIEETSSGVCVEQDEQLIEKCIESLLGGGTMGVSPQGLPARFDRRQIALDFLNLIEKEFAARMKMAAK